MAEVVKVVVDERAVKELASDPKMGQEMLRLAAPVAREARARALKRTGRGAASIHPEQARDGDEQTVHIGWDRDHFYMYFHEKGTRKLPARPFLVPTLEGFR